MVLNTGSYIGVRRGPQVTASSRRHGTQSFESAQASVEGAEIVSGEYAEILAFQKARRTSLTARIAARH